MVPTQKMPGAIKHWGSEGPATGDDYISWNLYLTFVLNPNLRNMDYSHILTHLQTNISLKHLLLYRRHCRIAGDSYSYCTVILFWEHNISCLVYSKSFSDGYKYLPIAPVSYLLHIAPFSSLSPPDPLPPKLSSSVAYTLHSPPLKIP